MGSHAKPRTTGRRTAAGALAVGATLTGVGLTAAALDPATAVLTADAGETGSSATIALSGLSTPVILSPDSAGGQSLTAAPLTAVGSLTGSANGLVGTGLNSAGGLARGASSRTLDLSTTPAPVPAAGAAASGSGQRAISPIPQGSAVLAGYAGKHRQQTRSAAPPSDVTPLTDEASSAATSALPAVTGLAANVPVLADVMRGSGAGETASGVLGTATGTLGGTAAGPVSGLLGSVPLFGPLVGGSGDGSSTLTVPGLSALSALTG
jgi:phosphohistidine swiveling domain-containing protein